jgi:hypothetical protein
MLISLSRARSLIVVFSGRQVGRPSNELASCRGEFNGARVSMAMLARGGFVGGRLASAH